ncbi:hypothetical protein [Halosimplex halophilum]|uniref:hypothetical protein n=1 Tax=Halosimplex halophilum TaxID=2559572 RepID=UPI00107F8156|nr:hypothetical protein [Halosimplex halophilum]
MSPTDPSADERGAAGALVCSPRSRAVAAAVAVLAVSWRAGTTAVFATGGLVSAFAVAILVRPGVRERWAFNVGLAVAFAVYGLAYAATVAGTAGLATGGLVVVLAALTVGNHLGVAPWSDHPRRI